MRIPLQKSVALRRKDSASEPFLNWSAIFRFEHCKWLHTRIAPSLNASPSDSAATWLALPLLLKSQSLISYLVRKKSWPGDSLWQMRRRW